ncbi:hypothetical protein ABTY00_37835, partial [Streptomyces microflavus]|uniref:hypothetical protein n=1 Tax=Streptomyces microflavus TaxID=1919 RepID=UPI0033204B02
MRDSRRLRLPYQRSHGRQGLSHAIVVLLSHRLAIEVISFGESAVADEGAGDAGEGEEVVGFAFVA